ncbi:hypothetical protein OG709_10390 [Streptomyces sp. NBC_01267]|uniref:hypothetical protein n=1 Tax=Streptomyces sp. NBC_01267 TaxID=2903805 RepID=UPI002E3701E7|nr:hypothetical protein [Streptomyces sp. NBC_01267]
MNGLLEAGAVLPAGGAEGDALTARAYEHPVLEGRTVVRLVPEAIGPAEDLALEYLGFGAAAPVVVGRVKRRSLGFPAWALVNDPANGHHALAVVKEMERLTRLVTSKPGHAKDGFDEIGVRLDRSVPHFLPTFYEQVARLFLAAESQQQASTFFGKARAAEQRHALEVDEDRLREVFLEFAGAGALSGKAMRDHAKGLAERLSAEAAYAEFRTLSVERCGAGLAPYAGMLEDLRRLARSAGLDARAEERSVLGEIIQLGGMNRAAASFWKSALPALAEAAAGDRTVQERLLALLPTAGGDSTAEFDAAWLGVLETCGAIDLLTDGTVPAAEWLASWAAHRQRGWRQSRRLADELALVERLAPRLIADGTPVELVGGGRRRADVDLDLLDTCLAAGIPVADPVSGARPLDLREWLADDGPGRRDLAVLLSDTRFVPMVRQAVENLATYGGSGNGPSARLGKAAEHPSLHGAMAGWLDDRAEELGQPLGLPGLNSLLSRVARFSAPSVLATSEAATQRITTFDPVPVLGRTLRAGILDELGWPALEQALGTLGEVDAPTQGGRYFTARDRWYRAEDAWPALVVRTGLQVALAGPDAVLDQRTLPMPGPNSHGEPIVRHVDGQWLVASWHNGEWRATWSGRQADVFRPTGLDGAAYTDHTVSLPLPEGGRCYGGRPVHAGDTSFAEQRREVASDGVSYWVLHEGRWYEYDPQSARRGRASVPAVFDAALAQALAGAGSGTGTHLEERASQLLPVPPGLEASPFGTKDGLLGWSVTYEADSGARTACSVDGTRGLPTTDGYPVAPLRLPAGAVLHPVRTGHGRGVVELRDTQGVVVGQVTPREGGGVHAAGTRFVPPLWYWHALRPRDEQGSAVLRSVTDADAAALLAAVDEGLDAAGAVARVLPGITDPALAAGVAGLVTETVRCRERIAQLAERAAAPAPAKSTRVVRAARDGLLLRSLGGLLESGGYWSSHSDAEGTTTLDHLHLFQALLNEPRSAATTQVNLADTRVEWQRFIGEGMATVALRAVSSGTDAEERAAAAEFVEAALAAGPDGDSLLADPRGRLRTLQLCSPPIAGHTGIGTVHRAGNRLVLLTNSQWHRGDRKHWTAVEYDPAGEFGPWEGFTIHESQVHGAPGDPVRAPALRKLLALAETRGPLAFRPEQAIGFAKATGVSVGAALLLLLGLPRLHESGRDGLPGAAWLDPLGLKVTQVKSARETLQELRGGQRRHFPGLLIPTDPEAVEPLWERGFDLGPLTREWIAVHGKQRAMPQPLLDRAVREGLVAAEVQLTLNPQLDIRLRGRTVQRVEDGEVTCAEPAKLVGLPHLLGLATRLRWLAYRLPYGDALRAVLPETLRAVRDRLTDPGLLLQVDQGWTQPGVLSLSERVREMYAMPKTGGENADGLVPAGPALVLGPNRYSGLYGRETVWLRPAALSESSAAAGDDAVSDSGGPALQLVLAAADDPRPLGALRTLLSPEFMDLLSADGPAGAPQDPTVSAPGPLSDAADRFGLSPDAAVVYLMLLALPDPTDRNQAEWTGWKPARLKRARAELAATDLVLEAKRARAGRSLFLPGGWLERRTPQLPHELWKTALLAEADGSFEVPDIPVPQLYERAWQRVVDGDAPGFEEFTGRERGRGRR